jgi:hypothetical protein
LIHALNNFGMRFRSLLTGNYLLLLISCSLSASGQQRVENAPSKSLTYAFVSPNTREGLTLDDAIRGLSSAEEETLLRKAHGLGCVAQTKIHTLKAVGSWSDGAEHSVLLRLQSDVPTVRYIVSVLGRDAQQKAALYFRSDSAGTAQLFTLRSHRRPIQRLSVLLDQLDIEFRTLVPTKTSTLVYVVDLKRELQSKILAAARKLRARVNSKRGTAEFVGDDSSREKAAVVFAGEIKQYESANPALVKKCSRIQRVPL